MNLEKVAGRAGARDLFVLHRVDDLRLVNLDGFGRGAGWAGNLVVEPASEPLLARGLAEGFAAVKRSLPARVFGPYWATEAAVCLTADGAVVFGGEGISEASPDLLSELAGVAAAHVSEVPVAKRLADELEVSQAALAIATMRPASVDEAATAIASRAAQALSCEFAAVLLHGPPRRLFIADEGWRPLADEAEVVAALLPLVQAAREGVFVEQDLSCSPFPYHPLAFEDGLVARVAVPLGHDGELGMLVIAHAAGAPRGFTSLCQRVAHTIASTAETLVQEMVQRESSPVP